MKRTLMGGLIIATMWGTAVAHGPSGSYEGDRTHRTQNNQVRCAKGTAAAGYKVYGGTNGAEVCKDSGAGIQGRAIVSRSGYAAADGDANNPSAARGYLRVDRSGPRCSAGRDQDSTHSRTRGATTCRPG